jgi:photosystem II stability/assembly factor-like uncharacterized protein/DNA-binding FrmR family transcriptional regulator
MKKIIFILIATLIFTSPLFSQRKKKRNKKSNATEQAVFDAKKFEALKWRNIGPFRGGRSNAVCGVLGDPMTYYMGSTGGGVWKTNDAGISWKNISDGFLKTGSVGALEVAPSDPNVIYLGMGEHAVRGVMTSHGDGMYRSTDAGQTWEHIGLPESHHIAEIQIHPKNPDVVWVAVQGKLWGKSKERGVYKSIDGGKNWKQTLFVNENTGAADLSLDESNPRILFAGMWDHQRTPWQVRSGGEGSGIWKSTDGGDTWKKLEGGLPKKMGKVAVDVSPANPQRIFANIEAEKGGVFRSDDGGKSWKQVCSDRITITRAWYYIEIFADPVDENKVYVLNAPMLKSINGGKSFSRISNPHSDQHHMWINPGNPNNIILANDGGGCITFNGGKTWSTENNQPTAQFYRVSADNRFPYHLYGGQQDNSTVAISSQTAGGGIGIRDWYPVAGGESAFIAFNDPDNPTKVFGTTIQGFIDVWDSQTKLTKDIQPYPQAKLGTNPNEQKYRFNWNPPLVASQKNKNVLYFGGNVLFRSDDQGQSWTEISGDLTRNDTTRHGDGGVPFTNEGAGGEVYNTFSYISTSPHDAGEIWVGTDDGLVHVTQDEGKTWSNVTPKDLQESLINAIEISPTNAGTAYLAVTRYKWNDDTPMIFKTTDYGENWTKITNGISANNFVRVVREDPKQSNILYAGTERGLYISFDAGENWTAYQANLPMVPINDLLVKNNDLIAATGGRAFWILDDLSALQQTKGLPDSTKITAIQPSPTVKFTLGSSSRDNYGTNPNAGVTLDYYLPHSWVDSNELKLEIIDYAGNVIRTFSNQKAKKMKRWEGGPPPAQVIPSKPGLNRTNWDLHRETLPAVEDVFVMGDYRGHTVAPGRYTLRFTSDKKVVETTCEVLPDPRINADGKVYAEQQALLMKIENSVYDIHESVNRLRTVKTQLNSRVKLLEDMADVEDLLGKGKAVEQAITNWEKSLIQPNSETFQDVINFKNQLNTELLNLKGVLDSHDPRPTAGVKLRLNEVLEMWKTMKGEMEFIIQEEVGGFNQMYSAKNLPILILPKKAKEKADKP